MDSSFLAYLQKLEVMAFFSAYPLIYAVILFIAGQLPTKNDLNKKIVSLLPLAYALTGILFLGFQLKKLFPDYSFEHIKLTIQQPYLIIWALLSVLFWLPVFRKKTVFSLIHSLVFLYFLVSDLFIQLTSPLADNNIIKNDMKVYAASLALNLAALVFLALLSLFFNRYRKTLRA